MAVNITVGTNPDAESTLALARRFLHAVGKVIAKISYIDATAWYENLSFQ